VLVVGLRPLRVVILGVRFRPGMMLGGLHGCRAGWRSCERPTDRLRQPRPRGGSQLRARDTGVTLGSGPGGRASRRGRGSPSRLSACVRHRGATPRARAPAGQPRSGRRSGALCRAPQAFLGPTDGAQPCRPGGPVPSLHRAGLRRRSPRRPLRRRAPRAPGAWHDSGSATRQPWAAPKRGRQGTQRRAPLRRRRPGVRPRRRCSARSAFRAACPGQTGTPGRPQPARNGDAPTPRGPRRMRGRPPRRQASRPRTACSP
jgi:hypothetical protein